MRISRCIEKGGFKGPQGCLTPLYPPEKTSFGTKSGTSFSLAVSTEWKLKRPPLSINPEDRRKQRRVIWTPLSLSYLWFRQFTEKHLNI